MAAAASRGKKKKQLLPGSLEARLKTGANKIAGAALGLAALVSWLFLMTWSVRDPSLSRAIDGPINNLGGKFGAIFSDILFQSFGLASIILILPIAALGFYLFFGTKVSHLRLRLLSWPLAIVLLSTTLSLLPVSQNWPLPQSYGGIVGDTFAKIFALDALASQSSLYTIALFGALGLLTVYALSFTTAIYIRDAKVLLNIESGEEFRALLQSPFHRLALWHHNRRARHSYNQENRHQRLWWRNASFDETENNPPSAGRTEPGFKIHQPTPAMPKPLRPGAPLKGDHPFNRAADGNTPFYELPPMSAKPDYQPQRPVKNDQQPAPLKFKPATERHSQKPHPAVEGTGHILPPIELLSQPEAQAALNYTREELTDLALMLENVLLDFGIKGSILNVRPGPVVTLFEFEPARGTKTARIIGLADDIARSMSAVSARIAVIPGRTVIGIELPNPDRETVFLRELVEDTALEKSEESLPLILGKSIGGEPVVQDLASMPHLLIAGTTGAGKSVGINTMLLSLLYHLTPKECRLILIDPKMLELSIYDGIPHLLTPVVTDPMKALTALKWAVREMEDRYRQMSKLGVRNIEGFNERVNQALESEEPLQRTVQTGFDQQTGRAIFEQETLTFEPLPKIVIVIDEMADLMMVAGKEIEMAVQRLAQMARAAGIHVIMATQRPSVDVITGTIKANFPTRISFQVTSKIDSRTILGREGAEQLLGRGDMLFMPAGSRLERVHGAFVDDSEVSRVVEFLRAQGCPEYLETITLEEEEENGLNSGGGSKSGEDIYAQAIEIVIRDQKATISYLQRRLSIGYNRAATLIEQMENEGIVSPANRAGKREVLRDQL